MVSTWFPHTHFCTSWLPHTHFLKLSERYFLHIFSTFLTSRENSYNIFLTINCCNVPDNVFILTAVAIQNVFTTGNNNKLPTINITSCFLSMCSLNCGPTQRFCHRPTININSCFLSICSLNCGPT